MQVTITRPILIDGEHVAPGTPADLPKRLATDLIQMGKARQGVEHSTIETATIDPVAEVADAPEQAPKKRRRTNSNRTATKKG